MAFFPLSGTVILAILLPNLLLAFFPPQTRLAAAPTGGRRLRILTVLERAGQVGCFSIPFFYPLRLANPAQVAALVVMAGALGLYYAGWARYLVRGRAARLLFRSLLGIPLPLAVLPVIYFLAASVLLGSVWMALAALVLGVGHIGVTWLNSRGAASIPAPETG